MQGDADDPDDDANGTDADDGVDAHDADTEDAGDADAAVDYHDGDAGDADPATANHAASARETESVDSEGESVEGVDTEHVMNLTFVATLLFGVPTVVVLSLFVPLDGWGEIIGFVVRVGAAIWFLTAVTLYVRERVRD